jgi:hypothetical protein
MGIELFICALVITWIVFQFATAGPRYCPITEQRYKELRFKRFVEGGRVRWEPYGRPTTSLAWA